MYYHGLAKHNLSQAQSHLQEVSAQLTQALMLSRSDKRLLSLLEVNIAQPIVCTMPVLKGFFYDLSFSSRTAHLVCGLTVLH